MGFQPFAVDWEGTQHTSVAPVLSADLTNVKVQACIFQCIKMLNGVYLIRPHGSAYGSFSHACEKVIAAYCGAYVPPVPSLSVTHSSRPGSSHLKGVAADERQIN